jgi:hypothetical protein
MHHFQVTLKSGATLTFSIADGIVGPREVAPLAAASGREFSRAQGSPVAKLERFGHTSKSHAA